VLIGRIIRPEWADYWKRLCPSASSGWPSPSITSKLPSFCCALCLLIESYADVAYIDDRIPVWPPDVWALLYGRMSYPDWNVPWMNTHHITQLFSLTPSYAFGQVNPLANLQRINKLYTLLINPSDAPIQRRAESAVLELLNGEEGGGMEFLERLPLGMAAPLREAMRTCQQAPPENWPANVYKAIGRNDLAASTQDLSTIVNQTDAGYRPKKEFIVSFPFLSSSLTR
jgi:anaphase-promoting complex subunit 1